MKESEYKTGDKFVCRLSHRSLTVGKVYEVAGFDEINNRYKVFNDLGGWSTLTSSEMVKVIEDTSFIERDGKYNLEVTGEQLAWLRLITGKSCDSKGLLSTIERMLQYKSNILPDRTGILTETARGFDAGKQSGINSWLDQFFTKPLSSEEKRIQELQDTINKAQEEIKKAQEQIKGLKKV